jgi:F-type H+-transporting ATPase subunit delta
MKNYRIAERYARGLSRVIEDDATLESALQALEDFSEVLRQSHDLRSVLLNPAFDTGQRSAVLADVLARLEVGPPVANLLAVLLRRGRMAMLEDVATVFGTLADERLNRVLARVTTPQPLDDAERARTRAALERWSGKTVRLRCRVDQEVLGGMVARIGSTVIDGTLRSRLTQLRTALLADER